MFEPVKCLKLFPRYLIVIKQIDTINKWSKKVTQYKFARQKQRRLEY